MKNKNVWLITIFSLLACILHAIMLQTPFNLYLYTSLFKIFVFILFPALCFLILKKHKLKDLFNFKSDKKGIKLSLISGFGVFAFILIAFTIIRPFLEQDMIIDALDHNGITSGNFWLVFIYIVLINALLEEVFFRGFIFLTLHNMGYKKYAHIYSSLLFAVYHVAILNNAVNIGVFAFLIFGLVVAGLIFNYFALRCKSISGCLIVHASANLALNLIVVMYLFA